MQHDESEFNGILLPDARTAYHLRRVKDKVAGATTAWDVIQQEYWPVLEIMQDVKKAADRNAAFVLWVAKHVPGEDVESMKYRNEIHRRVELAFVDPDKPRAKADWHTDASYFQDQEGAPPVIWAADVVEREIEWLWPGRIPLGKLTTLAGPGGVGKSFLLCDVAARVSKGMEWPFSGGELAVPGNVLYISGEDDIEDTLRPRLRLQGANLEKVAFPSIQEILGFNLSGEKFRKTADRVVEFMKAWNGEGCRLIVIDPPTSFLAGIDENSNAEVRGFLTPMKEWAAANNCAIVFNSHVNKAAGKKLDVQQRVIGSVAMVNGPRAAHLVTVSEDDPDVKLYVPLKMNLWERSPALSFRIVRDLHEVKHAKLEWIAEVEIDAGDAVNGREDVRKCDTGEQLQKQLERWLIARFKDQPVWTTKELADRLKADLDLEVGATFDRVTKELDIRGRRVGKFWERYVTPDWVYSQF